MIDKKTVYDDEDLKKSPVIQNEIRTSTIGPNQFALAKTALYGGLSLLFVIVIGIFIVAYKDGLGKEILESQMLGIIVGGTFGTLFGLGMGKAFE